MFISQQLRAALILFAIGSITLPACYCAAHGKANESIAHKANSQQSSKKQILTALKKKVSFEFVETPLSEVVDYFQSLTNIPFVLDTAELKTVGVDGNTKVTKSLAGVSLKSALNLMLHDLEITWTIRNDKLVITTPKAAEKH